MRAGTSAVVGGVLLAIIEGLTLMLSNPAFMGQDTAPPPPPMPEPVQQPGGADDFNFAYGNTQQEGSSDTPFGFNTR